ncbi:hypothetical protein RMSM_04837 [Rhodopirellula maiorica SM1]|uniref:Uncharacterized protein n=1 Tax=Rhodopirellula maiorica SM1 TaxID=1265738 RepID=M5RFI3_9BACT|nr:hypothetical protein RMSM_04837 [Rhodopirellula maiorica SM1]
MRELIYWGQRLQNAHPSVQLTNSAYQRAVFTGSFGYAGGAGECIDGGTGCNDFDDQDGGGRDRRANPPKGLDTSNRSTQSRESPADYEKSLTAHLAQLIIQRRHFRL